MTDRRWIPPLAWAAVILILTSIPVPRIGAPASTDKVVHLAVYAVLGVLLARAPHRPRVGTLVALAAGAALFGALDEFHQRFIPGRSASVDDWVADAVGGALGIIAYAAARARREPLT